MLMNLIMPCAIKTNASTGGRKGRPLRPRLLLPEWQFVEGISSYYEYRVVALESKCDDFQKHGTEQMGDVK